MINFTLAEPTDLDLLLTLVQEFCKYNGHPFVETNVRHALHLLMTDPALGRVWLIHQDEAIAGYVVMTLGFSLEYHGRDAFIDEVYLRENYRGQGVGTATFAFVEGFCRSLGVKALHLEVERENLKAQTFYRKLGYESQDRYLLNKWL
jgi:GNAT superfamily N-acetyltransferase